MGELTRAVHRVLFADDGHDVYTIIDGAAVPRLRQTLSAQAAENACLYSGELDDDIAEIAPYLVRLQREHPFTDWLLDNAWGNSCCIFASVPDELAFRDVRRHFRTFLKVRAPDGKLLLFRYYDPRVLREHLPSARGVEICSIFGPVVRFFVEAADARALQRFSNCNGVLSQQTLSLAH